ncbi:MAG: hypothetical protein J6X84_08945 [Treponema sp.]|nr:hypothetical protein [Treponema sp.]
MKKFLACVFILAVFALAIFYIGWTQIRVKPDSMGIVISKTSGIDETPVLNGKFSWKWQFLLPTNAIIKTFEIKPLNTKKTVSGTLPSGEAYASIFNADKLFDYSFTFDISLTVSPQAVLELVKQNKITDDKDLAEYLEGAAATLAQNAAAYFLGKAGENALFRPEAVRRDEILRGIQIYKDFPEIDVTIFALTDSKLPDFNMYKKISGMNPQELNLKISATENKSENQTDNQTKNDNQNQISDSLTNSEEL